MESVLLIILIFVIALVALFAGFTLYAIYSCAPYVPTLNRLVTNMLDMAEVGGKDTVVDLGSGDGRIVMAAADRGAKAVGYEINPILVLIGKWRLKSKFKNPNFKLSSKSKIQNFLTFGLWTFFDIWHSGFGFKNKDNEYPRIYWKNFWREDLSSATVITIFGFPNMMERLEKKLQKELKPGSRVVSHAFKFPTWKPVKREGGVLLYHVD